MRLNIVRRSEVAESFRVAAVRGLFDLPDSGVVENRWKVNFPLDEKPWQVGLIVGPSGAGKTTIATELVGAKALAKSPRWKRDAAIVDGFPKGMSAKEVTSVLGAVGLSSAPSWIQPYGHLSNGQKFRADLARMLAETGWNDVLAIDEFTSVVDRQVAKACSHAVQKYIRRFNRKTSDERGTSSAPVAKQVGSDVFDGKTSDERGASSAPVGGQATSDDFDGKTSDERGQAESGVLGAENSNGNDDLPPRLVAISCHYDVEDWLDPDWVFDVAECSFQWRRRRRHPEIRMRVWETPRSTWKLFRRHHYLNHEIPNNAKCYVAEWDGVPVAFCAVVHQMHQSNGPLKFHRRCSRLVVDPDYQGLGFGPRLLNHIADLYRREDSGRRFTIRTSHPGLVHWLRRSRRWRVLDKANHVAAEGAKQGGRSESRLTQGFEYLLTRRK